MRTVEIQIVPVVAVNSHLNFLVSVLEVLDVSTILKDLLRRMDEINDVDKLLDHLTEVKHQVHDFLIGVNGRISAVELLQEGSILSAASHSSLVQILNDLEVDRGGCINDGFGFVLIQIRHRKLRIGIQSIL